MEKTLNVENDMKKKWHAMDRVKSKKKVAMSAEET